MAMNSDNEAALFRQRERDEMRKQLGHESVIRTVEADSLSYDVEAGGDSSISREKEPASPEEERMPKPFMNDRMQN